MAFFFPSVFQFSIAFCEDLLFFKGTLHTSMYTEYFYVHMLMI